ncbi:MAG: polysaccharide biosynthesis C-terminal domain-containing protein, partial [Acidobacteriota bacterium]|nr:polysaccharide biosynthesis C-terminal domain-containing protein [Acidobacteriota bacterium]
AAQISCVLVMLAGILKVLRPRLRFSKAVFLKELNYGLRGYLGAITEFAVWRLDQIMLTALASASVIGLYAIAVAIADITATLASSVSDALLPEVAASKNRRKASHLLARSLRLTLYAQIIALIPLWILAPWVLEFVFGSEFVAAAAVMRLLLVASIFWSAGLIFISGLNGIGKPGLTTMARIASAVTTVVTLLLLMPAYGITGAAVSSILGYAVLSGLAGYFFMKNSGVGFWEFIRPRANDISVSRFLAAVGLGRAFGGKLGFGPHPVD